MKYLFIICTMMVSAIHSSLTIASESKFELGHIPPIKNKQPINIALADFSADILPFFKAFEKKTGIQITTETVFFKDLYNNEILDLMAGTGRFDVVVVEASWTNEFKKYLIPIYQLAEQYDSAANLNHHLAGVDTGLLRMSSTSDGILIGIPYSQYTMIYIYRKDIFDHPSEKEVFRKHYGYDLGPATDWKQILDQGEFFTRKKGETLKGKVLTKDLFGLSMMGGNFPHVQDELGSRIWSRSGHWASPVRQGGMPNGKLIGFKVTDYDTDILRWAFENYVKALTYSPPESRDRYWDYAASEFHEGNTVIMPTAYTALYFWLAKVEEKIENAIIGAAPCPGLRPYTGVFHLSVSKDTGNTEAAYWLIKYASSFHVQKELTAKAWPSVRIDVFEDPRYHDFRNQMFRWIPPTLVTWKAQLPDVNDYLHFNSAAFGKIYEEMTVIGHENAVGKRPPDEGVVKWLKVFTDLQNNHGQLPVVD